MITAVIAYTSPVSNNSKYVIGNSSSERKTVVNPFFEWPPPLPSLLIEYATCPYNSNTLLEQRCQLPIFSGSVYPPGSPGELGPGWLRYHHQATLLNIVGSQLWGGTLFTNTQINIWTISSRIHIWLAMGLTLHYWNHSLPTYFCVDKTTRTD